MKKRGSAQVKEKSVYLGVISVLILVILFMSFSTNFNAFSGRGTEQLMKMQIIQLLAQEDALSVDAATAMNMIDLDELIGSCTEGVVDYLISEGVIGEADKYTVISVISDGFDDAMIPDGPKKERRSPFCPT